MASCSECDRRRRYMAADPEMYRGEDTRCEAHRRDAGRLSDEQLRDRIVGLESELCQRGHTMGAWIRCHDRFKAENDQLKAKLAEVNASLDQYRERCTDLMDLVAAQGDRLTEAHRRVNEAKEFADHHKRRC